MGLETATTIPELNPAWPLGSDDAGLGDDHLRLIKSVLQNIFPKMDTPIKASGAKLNSVLGMFNDNGTVPTVASPRTSGSVLPASQIMSLLAEYLPLTGGTLSGGFQATGPITSLSGDGSNFYIIKRPYNTDKSNYGTVALLAYDGRQNVVKEWHFNFDGTVTDPSGNVLATQTWANGAFVKDNGVTALSISRAGLLQYQTPDGKQWPVQSAGDYATNASLQAAKYALQQSINTATSNVASGAINNGWYLRIGNVITQHFAYPVPSGNSMPVIPFPIAFAPGTIPKVNLTVNDEPGGNSRWVSLSAYMEITNSSCKVHMTQAGNSTGSSNSAGTIMVHVTGQQA